MKIVFTGIGLFFLVVVLLFSLKWMGLITLPYWLTLERKAYTHSHQYVESKRAAIVRYVAECATLPDGPQKKVLRQRIAAEMALLPKDIYINTGDCR